MNEDTEGYKFKPINKYLIDSLVNPSLYFAKLEKLNDPFDCRLDIEKAIRKSILSTTGTHKEYLTSWLEHYSESFDNLRLSLDKVGVFSFSKVSPETLRETLLWSHYADNHKGVCLKYVLPKDFILGEDFEPVAGGEVEYNPDPLTGWLTNPTICNLTFDNFIIRLLHIYLKSKNPSWKYEKEARIIRNNHGVYKIKGEFLREVYFGLQTPQSEIDLVQKLSRQFCGCKSFYKMIPGEGDYGFTPLPI